MLHSWQPFQQAPLVGGTAFDETGSSVHVDVGEAVGGPDAHGP